jgi:hypothetical protein
MTTGSGIAILGIWVSAAIIISTNAYTGRPNDLIILAVILSTVMIALAGKLRI